MIYGNIQSLKQSIISELEGLYLIEASNDFVPYALIEKMAELTYAVNREIAVYINRKGKVLNVMVGDHSTVSLQEITERRGQRLLCGVRCIHTHPNGDGQLSSIDINSLISMHLDAMVAVGVKDGKCTNIGIGIPSISKDCVIEKADLYGPFLPGEKDLSILFKLISQIDAALKSADSVSSLDEIEERAVLVGVDLSGKNSNESSSDSAALLDELEELALTAGAKVLSKVIQRRSSIDSAYFIGKGKAEELSMLCQSVNANLVIFDEELSGSQVRNLEEILGVNIVDRTTLILDIFAKRAKSLEGKIQVELAQLKYMLTRLIGLGAELSRLGGGIGTRGPGEKKLEVDRRHIRTRIKYLTAELEEIKKRRNIQRQNRKDTPVVALVGYTNAGKSTLLNRLCGSDVLVEDKLFATLDPTARKLLLPNGRPVILVDTVGFIRKLPHHLVEAFKSTLEEAVYSDAIIHVIDASNPEIQSHIAVVDKILEDLGASGKPTIMAFNKTDIGSPDILTFGSSQGRQFVEISALNGSGLEALLDSLSGMLYAETFSAEFLIPYHESWAVNYLHQNAEVTNLAYNPEGSQVTAEVTTPVYEKLNSFCISKNQE